MEARADVRRTGISKAFTALVLVLIAAGLGLMGAFLAANLGGHSATQSPTTQGAPGGAHIYRSVRSGAQIDDSGPVAPTPVFTLRAGHRE